MNVNKFGQVTNNSSDLLLTPKQEEFMLSLMESPNKSTDIARRYAKAIYYNKLVPTVVYDYAFNNLEEAFTCMATLEWECEHCPNFDQHDWNVLQELHYYFNDNE